jgi:hypothetical protein
MACDRRRVLGAGIDNIVLATPLLLALRNVGLVVDLVLATDYSEPQIYCPLECRAENFHPQLPQHEELLIRDSRYPALLLATLCEALFRRPRRASETLFCQNEKE